MGRSLYRPDPAEHRLRVSVAIGDEGTDGLVSGLLETPQRGRKGRRSDASTLVVRVGHDIRDEGVSPRAEDKAGGNDVVVNKRNAGVGQVGIVVKELPDLLARLDDGLVLEVDGPAVGIEHEVGEGLGVFWCRWSRLNRLVCVIDPICQVDGVVMSGRL